MKLTVICLIIQAIFLYRKVGLASGFLNAAGGFSNVGNLMSVDGLLNTVQGNSFTPAPIKAAIVGGKAVTKGVQVYKETGDFAKAGTAAANSGFENAVNVVNGVPGAKLGLGVINDWKNGESWSTIVSNGGKEALNILPMGEQVKDLAMTGVSAAQAYKEGKSITEVVTEGVKGTLKNYANKHPMAAEVEKFIKTIPKDEPGAPPKSWIEKGIDIAQNSPLAPAPLKGALAAGKAVAKGVQAFRETGDVKKAGLVAGQAGLGEAVKVANNVPGAQLGMNLLNDLQNGESVQTIIMNGGKEAINFLPADGPAKDLAMKGLGAAQAVKDGQSLANVVGESVKGTLMDYASKHPMAKQVKEYAEIGEKVARLLPKNDPNASPEARLVNGGIDIINNPKLDGVVSAGKALADGVETYKKTKDIKKATKAATDSGLKNAANIVNNVPGAELGINLLKDLKNGESLQTAIINNGQEAIDFLPVDGPVKDLVINGIAASQAFKEKKNVQDVVKEGVKGTILEYASKRPSTKEVEKYVEKSEELAACLPQTERENVPKRNKRRGIGRTDDAFKSHITQKKRRGISIAWMKSDAKQYRKKKNTVTT